QVIWSNLEMVTRHYFVVDGCVLQPGAELGGAGRHVPPHAARPGEVLAGAGVVDAARAGAVDPALQVPQRCGDVEVRAGEVVDRAVAEILHPGPQLPGAVQHSRASGVQRLRRGLHRAACAVARARVDPGGHLLLLGDHGAQLLDAPGVGLVDVDRGAQEGA